MAEKMNPNRRSYQDTTIQASRNIGSSHNELMLIVNPSTLHPAAMCNQTHEIRYAKIPPDWIAKSLQAGSSNLFYNIPYTR